MDVVRLSTRRLRCGWLLVLATVTWLAPPATAQSRLYGWLRPVLNPRTYTSPSGTCALFVDPSEKYGQGAGTYRMTRNGREVWTATLPFTLLEAEVLDDGVAVGYAHFSSGTPGRSGYAEFLDRIHLVILNADGSVRMNETLSRRYSSFGWDSYATRRIDELLPDHENDRLLVRFSETHWTETWRIFQLSTGTFLDEFRLVHPDGSANESWRLLTVRPVAGTPLWLVNWRYEKSETRDSSKGQAGAAFTLLDDTANAVWELFLPGDYPHRSEYWYAAADDAEAAEHERLSAISERVDRHGTILQTDQPGQFDLWLVKAGQRVTFRVARDEAGGWTATERSRADYAPPPRDQTPPRQPDVLDKLSLQSLGTIELEPEPTPLPEVRDIADFAFDDHGRIGVLRAADDTATAVVLTDLDGTPLAVLDLNALLGGPELKNAGLVWSTADRWLLYGTTQEDADDEQHISTARVWSLDVVAATLKPIASFPRTELLSGASNQRGGAVFVLTPREGASCAVSLDDSGKELWRYAPDYDWLRSGPKPTIFADGLVAIPYQQCIVVLTADGECLHSFGYDTILEGNGSLNAGAVADNEGGVCFVSDEGQIWQMHADTSLQQLPSPTDPNGRPISMPADALRIDPTGTLWITDAQCLMRLDHQGVVDHVIGDPPASPALRKAGGVAIDHGGTICVSNKRNWATHIFDATGKRVRTLPPPPEGCNPHGGWLCCDDVNIAIAGDGSVLLGDCEFSPRGEYVGLHTLPDGVWRCCLTHSDVQYVPGLRRYWLAASARLVLVAEDNTIVQTIARRPNGNWIELVSAFTLAPDGALCVFAQQDLGSSGGGEPVLAFYDSEGRPERTIEPPPISSWYFRDWSRLAYNGRYVILQTHDAASLWLLDTAANPPKWYDADALAPTDDVGRFFFVNDGKELWRLTEKALKVERYALPE